MWLQLEIWPKKKELFIDKKNIKGEEMTKPSKKIPKFTSIHEEAKFWDTHDIGDYMSELSVIDAIYLPTDEVKTTMSIRVTPGLKRKVELLASKYETSASSLVRMWMIDRLSSSRKFR